MKMKICHWKIRFTYLFIFQKQSPFKTEVLPFTTLAVPVHPSELGSSILLCKLGLICSIF